MEWSSRGVTLSDDPGRVDVDVVHGFLRTSYWAPGIPRAIVERSIRGSLPFSLFRGAHQIGFARVVTDRASFGYLADVFVLEAERGKGLARWMMDCILAHPELASLRRWTLVTRDAHRLYEGVGFTAIASPETYMEKVRANPYGH